MTKQNDPELQSLLLDLFVMFGTDAEVARRGNVGRTTIWRMDTASEAGDDLQEVDWNGVIKPWHEHKLDALDMHVTDVCQELTISSSRGRTVPLVHGGCYQYEDCEFAHSLNEKQFKEYLAMDDDMRDVLGVPRVWEDKKKRVFNPKSGVWERVRAVQIIPPSLDAQAKVLSAFAPDVFGDKRTIDLNVRGGLGVAVLGKPMQPPQEVLDMTPSVPALTDQTTDAEVVEYNETPEPEAVMAEPEPFTPDPTSPLTEEQQRILARSRSTNPLAAELAATAAAKLAEAAKVAPAAPKPIRPPPPGSYTGRDTDPPDDVPRSPRGMKVC